MSRHMVFGPIIQRIAHVNTMQRLLSMNKLMTCSLWKRGLASGSEQLKKTALYDLHVSLGGKVKIVLL